MDTCITKLKSTTFFGQRLTRQQIATIQETVALFPALNRRELGRTICDHLGWYTPQGDYRIQLCLRLLVRLEELGILTLPTINKAQQRGPRKEITWTHRSAPQPVISDDLQQLTPLVLQVVTDQDAIEEWNEMVARHHYLSYTQPFGPHLRYYILDQQGRKLGCLLFAAAGSSLACRDTWIGWQHQKHKKQLHLVVNNSRFLILPWVKVKCLASMALSMATRKLADDWAVQHAYRPVLVETFVDLTRFKATCYRAANWQYLGLTQGRKAGRNNPGKSQKGVYVYPLIRQCRTLLRHGPPAATQSRRTPPTTCTAADPWVQQWQNILETLVTVTQQYDRVWQQRQRLLNTLLIVLFIFRLVFSKGQQGYAITLAELWEQCRTLQIALPKATPVSAAAMCKARARVHEDMFKDLHAAILKHTDRSAMDPLWHGHRMFAVDGSKLNLPRPLINSGYRIPSDNAWYPQGLLSCLYQMRSKLPIDFDLCAHQNERTAALAHVHALSKNDVVVYDRGYYSYEMLHEHARRGLHPIFRIKNKANPTFDKFISEAQTDAIVEVTPGQKSQQKLQAKYPQFDGPSYALRLVRYTVSGTTYILGTTLLDQGKYGIKDLSDVYHGRWGIEELYKISKQLMTIEDFHGQSERGVKQELFAHFNLMAMTRLFSNHSEQIIQAHRLDDGKPEIKTNFKNSLMIVARNIESLLLQQSIVLSATITHIVTSITACRQRLRPNKSYARRSRKPIGKWLPGK